MLEVVDLFSGIGGFALGLEAAGGYHVRDFCEISPSCRRLLAHHWPGIPIHDDITALSAADLPGRVDVVTAGFPCQDLSYAGLGAGLDGARSGLWFQIPRLVRQLASDGRGPRFIVLENVPALLSRGMGVVLRDLAALGFDAEWDCIPASARGAPHRRDRAWIVAYPGGEQHEGFGDALKWSIATQLHVADPASGGDGRDGGGPVEVSGEGATGVADAGRDGHWPDNGPGPDRSAPPEGQGDGDKRQWVWPLAWGGGSSLSHPGGPRFSLTERHAILRERGGQEGGAIAERGWWGVEPDVGRVAYGVPARVDRLHGLGNAVLPDFPYIIGKAITEAATLAGAHASR